jgi:hypothetical protein
MTDMNAKKRIAQLEDLLVSARVIVLRHGDNTAWDRFDARLQEAGIGCVTARTFKILPGEVEDPCLCGHGWEFHKPASPNTICGHADCECMSFDNTRAKPRVED